MSNCKKSIPNWPRCFRRCRTGLRANGNAGHGYDESLWNVWKHAAITMAMPVAWNPIVAAGLRMVADAIDRPALVEAMREVAETLAGPIASESTVWFAEFDRAYRNGLPLSFTAEAKATSATTQCPAKYPTPCLCGNQPTHERDVCPFEAPEAEAPDPLALGELSVVSDDRINAQLGINPKDVGLGAGL